MMKLKVSAAVFLTALVAFWIVFLMGDADSQAETAVLCTLFATIVLAILSSLFTLHRMAASGQIVVSLSNPE